MEKSNQKILERIAANDERIGNAAAAALDKAARATEGVVERMKSHFARWAEAAGLDEGTK